MISSEFKEKAGEEIFFAFGLAISHSLRVILPIAYMSHAADP
jgi:hypothetical protein